MATDKAKKMNDKNDNYWEEIDAYLDGETRGEARAAFRQRLSEEPELAKDTLFQRELRTGIAYGSQDDLRSRLRTIHAETVGGEQGEAKIVPIGRALWLRWAVAAAMVIGALGILFWVQQQPLDNAALFAANYEVYELDDTSRSPGAETPADLALAAYRAGNYPTAIQQLTQVLKNDSDNPQLQLALAVSYWEDGQPERAEAALRPLFDHPLLKDRAYWYAALFALAKEERAAALDYLRNIPADSGKLGREAAQLRQQLQD